MKSRFRSSVVRWTERLLWLVSLAALGAYGFAWTESRLYQSYADRSFMRTMNGEVPSPAPPVLAAPPNRPSSFTPWLGRLEIPAIDLSVIFLEGTDGLTLMHAVGHIPGTALPGAAGNVGLAGHRDTFFRRLGELRIGDSVRITTLNGHYEYVVDKLDIVDPKDVEVLDDAGRPVLTLVTCYPLWHVGPSPKRYVVRAALGGF